MLKHRTGRALDGFDHVQTLMTRSMSTVSAYASPKERAWISVGLKLSGVLHRWFDNWTKFPAIILMPRALKTWRVIIAQSRHPTYCYCPSFESMRHQNDSWESCPVVKPSVKHSRKLHTNANPGSFLVILDLHTGTGRYSGH